MLTMRNGTADSCASSAASPTAAGGPEPHDAGNEIINIGKITRHAYRRGSSISRSSRIALVNLNNAISGGPRDRRR